jgi:RND family efflux transporter MFP subunit
MIRAMSRKSLALGAILALLGAAFFLATMRSGPLAPVPVVVAEVREMAISPSLFGIGIVEARYVHAIGPTVAGRVARLEVHVGDRVKAGQVLGEMDPVDLDDRLRAQEAALLRAESAEHSARALVGELQARAAYATSQARRFGTLAASGAVSRDALEARQQELQVAESGLAAALAAADSAGHELERVRAEAEGVRQQRQKVRLVSPVAGLVTRRLAEPGTTVVAGQAVLEVVDPDSLWVNARFDQLRADGLGAGLPAHVTLRSRAGEALSGRVLRVEPVADAVTEELLAKIVFDSLPEPLPALGELAEVTVALPALPPAPAIPAGSVQREGNVLGAWVVEDGGIRFTPVELGPADLDGMIVIRSGLGAGRQVVSHSASPLKSRNSIRIVDSISGGKP